MSNVREIFRSASQSLWETMESHGGKVGFRIPEYQRPYDWDRSNLKRLLEDCLNGFYYLTQDSNQESYTFLGTIILVDEQRAESAFDGSSLQIVDGQQRLTTLSLLSCALLQQIFSTNNDIDTLNNTTKDWLRQELESVTEALFQCTSGYLTQRGIPTPFPRVVREGSDNRANTRRGSEYKSSIANFLWDFSQYYLDYNTSNDPHFDPTLESSDSIVTNFNYLREQIRKYVYEPEQTDESRPATDIDCEVVHRSEFQKQPMRRLFEKLSIFHDDRELNRAMASIAGNEPTEGFVRLILFSWYLLKCVVITRVETDQEKYAFDIFDALNTTGQPLTALETFKPFVVRWENQQRQYAGSYSESQFDRLDRDVNDRFRRTEDRQRETKYLVVSFALFHSGRKLGLDLSSQRAFLRNGFQTESENEDTAHRYVNGIADVAEFRRHYWEQNGISGLDARHPSDASRNDILKLCLSFISDMGTSLAIPALARYWVQFKNGGDEAPFLSATKSLAAFLAMRRAVTGGTGGIDSDLRSLMAGLCVSSGNQPMSNDQLNQLLRQSLVQKIGVEDKTSWVNKAKEIAIASHSSPLCRFLLFAAADNAKPDLGDPGMLSRDNLLRTAELDFFNYRVWRDQKYETVEHVAPDSNPGGGWDPTIYERPATRQTIGNLVLLPQKENSSLARIHRWDRAVRHLREMRGQGTGWRGPDADEMDDVGRGCRAKGMLMTRGSGIGSDFQRRPMAETVRSPAWRGWARRGASS